MGSRFDFRKKSFSLIGALLAVCALLLVICWMNEFGHGRSSTHASLNTSANTSANATETNRVDSPSDADVVLTPELLAENTAREVCSLKDLDLSSDDLLAITANKNLRGLKFSGCKFHGPYFSVQPNSELETIRISNSDLDGPLLNYLKRASSVKYLEIFACALQPHSLDSLTDTRIVWLQLRNSRELSRDNSFTAADLANVAKIPSLKHLELEQSQLQTNAILGLKMSGAEVVNLNHCDLTDADLETLASMKNLHFVDVSYNPKITYNGIKHLLLAPGIKQIKFDIDFPSQYFTTADRMRLDSARYTVPRSYYDGKAH